MTEHCRTHRQHLLSHRLYVQIYASFVVAIILFGLISSLLWWFGPARRSEQIYESLGGLIGDLLPPPDAPPERLQEVLGKIGGRVGVDITVCARDGTLLASTGRPLPPPPAREESRSGWTHKGGGGPVAVFHLPDGRVLMARHPGRPGPHYMFIALFALILALATYPVARRMTRRLERLRERVEKLGTGDLTARVEVEGNDEVASLAKSFNRAAERIEQLVKAQRAMLANASHELRSPLARLRMAVELLQGDDRPDLRSGIEKEIRELDELIGEILLASRLDAIADIEEIEEIDLSALVAEEAAAFDAAVSGDAVRIRADQRLLRRLVRNLLENASKHAPGSPVDVTLLLERDAGKAVLKVEDRGPGIAEVEREKIFEPFYKAANGTGARTSGAGLGLALVRQIARHHGGDVRCLPREGGGTCFEVVLTGASTPAASR